MARHAIQLAILLLLAGHAQGMRSRRAMSDAIDQMLVANHSQESSPSEGPNKLFLKRLHTIFFLMSMYQAQLGTAEVVVVQLDPATFPPAQQPSLVRHFAATRPPSNFYIQPAGRAIALSKGKLLEGFNRWRLLPYGAATKIKSKDVAHLSVVSHWEQIVGYDIGVLTHYIPQKICEDSGPLAGGRVYVYTGGCGPDAFKDILGFADWQNASSVGYEYFSSVFCGMLSADKLSTCIQYLACALDELYWSPETVRFEGGTVQVAGRASCPEAGATRRAGFFHKHSTCNCDFGECDFCGTEGL